MSEWPGSRAACSRIYQINRAKKHVAPSTQHQCPGHAHELTFSCYKRFAFLKAERTCRWLAEAIETARRTYRFDLWAYVFMPDHIHLIVHPRETDYDMAAIRKAIKAPVAKRAIRHLSEHAPTWLPKITRRRGSQRERLFWQSGGGYDRNVVESRTLLQMIDYLHLNPVRRGLAERSTDWKWSSATWFAMKAEAPIALDHIPAEWLT